jgi:hypothetical protein
MPFRPGAYPQLEMILQASEYESAQGIHLQEFFDSTKGKWRTSIGLQWAEEIGQRREQRQKDADTESMNENIK